MTEPKPTYTIEDYCDGSIGDGSNLNMIADLLEHITALELVVDAKEQAVEALRAHVDALEFENGKQRAQIVDLESRIREYQE